MGSHWETTLLFGEIMTAQATSSQVFYSEFTLAALYDMGWYEIDFTKAEEIQFGKNKGLDFYINACYSAKTYREFKNQGDVSCTFDYKGIGYAAQHSFGDACYISQEYSDSDCTNPQTAGAFIQNVGLGHTVSAQSRCFASNFIQTGLSTNLKARCFESFCANQKSKIYVKIFDQLYTCSENNQILTVDQIYNGNQYTGNLQCPSSINEFCSMKQICPD